MQRARGRKFRRPLWKYWKRALVLLIFFGVARRPAHLLRALLGSLIFLPHCSDSGSVANVAETSTLCAEFDCKGQCQVFGLCHPVVVGHGDSAICFCEAQTDADCLASNVCATEGLCREWFGACEADARHGCTGVACEDWGRCTPYGGVCVASPTGCHTSTQCKKTGRCTSCFDYGICYNLPPPYNKHQTGCVVSADADCKPSDVCANRGECFADRGYCAAVSDAECAKSAACAVHGRCGFDWNNVTCIARGPADCLASEDCKKSKLCTYSPKGECI